VRWGSIDDSELGNATEKIGGRLGLGDHGSAHRAWEWERKSLLASCGDLLEVLGPSSGEAVALAREACGGVKGERV